MSKRSPTRGAEKLCNRRIKLLKIIQNFVNASSYFRYSMLIFSASIPHGRSASGKFIDVALPYHMFDVSNY